MAKKYKPPPDVPGGLVDRKPRRKAPGALSPRYWLKLCPVCAEVGEVVGVVPMWVDASRRRYQWMCRACVVRHNATVTR